MSSIILLPGEETLKSLKSAWIGVDLDGTLAQYAGFKGPEHIGDPIHADFKLLRVSSPGRRMILDMINTFLRRMKCS
jgi:hypothetical protein